MNKERLNQLADMLADMPDSDHFDLDGWGRVRDCGTVACAVGWACLMPAFNKLGLSAQLNGNLANHQFLMPVYKDPATREVWQSWGAVKQFFDLHERDAFHLFQDSSYNQKNSKATPQDVAARIREFTGWTPPADAATELHEHHVRFEHERAFAERGGK